MKFKNTANVLKDLRLEANQTQLEFGKRIGVPESQFVSNWERGLCMPPAHAMKKLLRGVSQSNKKMIKENLGADLADHYWSKYE